MLEILMEMIKGVGIFILISQMILHFGIGKEYEKYLKLVVSFMVIAQIVFAFDTFFQKNFFGLRSNQKENYYENWNKKMEEFDKKFNDIQREVQMDLEQELYEQELYEQDNVCVLKEPSDDINEGMEDKIYINKIVIQ